MTEPAVEPAPGSGADAEYRAGAVDLLGILAYGALTAFERLAEDAGGAPTLADRVLMSTLAASQMDHFERVRGFLATFDAVERGLRRGEHMLRYAAEDDFGLPETAFNFCTFWLIEALHLVGRESEARELYEHMLERLTPAGLLSEDSDFETGELWGNYPQTYSLVGLINCAVLLSRPWSAVR